MPEVDVVVIGSLNQDLTVIAGHHPLPGETVLGSDHFTGAGGKGANQAVAAARLGARVAMVGRVGDDEHGRFLLDSLSLAGIDTGAVETDPERPTGIAVITLDTRGENAIVVSPGANAHLDHDQVRRHAGLFGVSKVCLAQLEVPVESVLAAARACPGKFILNLAPALPVSDRLLAEVDVLVVNRTELASLTGSEDPASLLGIDGPTTVVVTLGPDGAVFGEDGRLAQWVAPAVEVVDTTGAGDAFCGALAASLASDFALSAAVRRAVAAGAVATTKAGAQASMPGIEQVEAILERVGRG